MGEGVVQGVLLDFYGTFVHEDDVVIAAICDRVRMAIPEGSERPTAGQIGAQWWGRLRDGYHTARGETFERQRDLASRSLRATCTAFGADLDVDDLLALQFAHWVAPPIFPETHAFLGALRNLGVPVCIISNIDRQDLEAAMALHAIEADHVLTSEDVRSYKPNPELLLAALDALGLRPDDVLHIGDSRSSDVAGAAALGIPVVWVNRAGKLSAGMPLPGYKVGDLMASLQIIRRLMARPSGAPGDTGPDMGTAPGRNGGGHSPGAVRKGVLEMPGGIERGMPPGGQ